jgi:hypothetical protein
MVSEISDTNSILTRLIARESSIAYCRRERFISYSKHCAFLKQSNGFFGVPAINVLWAVLGGERHSHDDREFKALLHKITRLFRTGNPSGDVLDVLPFLRYFFPSLAGYRERNIATVGGQKFFQVSK